MFQNRLKIYKAVTQLWVLKIKMNKCRTTVNIFIKPNYQTYLYVLKFMMCSNKYLMMDHKLLKINL